jgi:uncharacterized protein (DUF2235 family)
MAPAQGETALAKNIVICSDGTGAAAAKNRGTNVFKLFEAVDLHGHEFDPELKQQIAFYDDGVGTQEWTPIKLLSGAFGFGLSRNVRQLYAELVRTYEPGRRAEWGQDGGEADSIYMFGYSRGAFTVRTLAGMVARIGILDAGKFETDRELRRAVRFAYRAYRLKYAALLQLFFLKLLTPWRPPQFSEYDALYRVRKLTYGDPPNIRFVGVWDTVDAVGLPVAGAAHALNTVFYRFKFSDMKLSPKVIAARQALSVDDERSTYHPLVWDERGGDSDRICQVWFAGAHSNVGGGSPKHGMSLVPLDWMMAEAEKAELRFVPSERSRYRALQDVNDKLYDSRSGAAAFFRYMPRNIHRTCEACGVSPAVHVSVLQRIAQGTEGYAPGNIPRESTFTTTRGLPSEGLVQAASDELGRHLAEALDKYVHDGDRQVSSLLDLVRGAVLVRHFTQLIGMGSIVGLAVLVYRVSRRLFDSWRPAGLGEGWDVLLAFLRGVRAGTPEALVACGLIAVLVVCGVLTKLARARMHRIYSGYWCDYRESLRELMASCLDPGGWTSSW